MVELTHLSHLVHPGLMVVEVAVQATSVVVAVVVLTPPVVPTLPVEEEDQDISIPLHHFTLLLRQVLIETIPVWDGLDLMDQDLIQLHLEQEKIIHKFHRWVLLAEVQRMEYYL